MQSKCKAMQSNFTRLVFVLILSNYLIINEAVALFRYAVFTLYRNVQRDFFFLSAVIIRGNFSLAKPLKMMNKLLHFSVIKSPQRRVFLLPLLSVNNQYDII